MDNTDLFNSLSTKQKVHCFLTIIRHVLIPRTPVADKQTKPDRDVYIFDLHTATTMKSDHGQLYTVEELKAAYLLLI